MPRKMANKGEGEGARLLATPARGRVGAGGRVQHLRQSFATAVRILHTVSLNSTAVGKYPKPH